jgi:UDP-N-acetylglucosamine 4,6-dehydratase
MISSDDSRRTFLIGERYVVTPVVAEWGFETPKGTPMAEGVAYQSHTNDLWMSQEDIKEFLNEI